MAVASNAIRRAERGAKLTDQLLSFSRRQRLEPKVLDLNHTVASMRDLLHSTIGGSVQIETSLAEDLWHALVDPTQLEPAVLNLAINARDAMGVGGQLTVSTGNATLGDPSSPEEPAAGDYVEICVSDTSSGMSPDERARVFEPFFTTKEIGKGSGLGLSQVLGFAKQSNGGVRIDTIEGCGTSIRIFLPRSDLAEDSAETLASHDDPTSRTAARILMSMTTTPCVRSQPISCATALTTSSMSAAPARHSTCYNQYRISICCCSTSPCPA